MARLGEAVRNQAIGMLVAGSTKAEVARRLNCHPTTISRLQRRYQHTGNVKDLPKSGRPRVTTRRQDVNIRVTHLRDRFTPAAETARRIRTIHGYVNLSPKHKNCASQNFYGKFKSDVRTCKLATRFFFGHVYCFKYPPLVPQLHKVSNKCITCTVTIDQTSENSRYISFMLDF